MKEVQIQIETLQNILVDIATGGDGNDSEYKSLRTALVSIYEIKDMLPHFLKTNRTTGQFWQYIKFKYPSYGERRKYIWDEFTKILDYVENKRELQRWY